MRTYTAQMAVCGIKSQLLPTYTNLWAFVSGEHTNEREAKKHLFAFIKKEGIGLDAIKEEYQASVTDQINEMALNGFFDF